MFNRLKQLFGGQKEAARELVDPASVPIRHGRTAEMQAILDRTFEETVRRCHLVEQHFVSRFGQPYRMLYDLHQSTIGLARGGSNDVELVVPCYVLGTEFCQDGVYWFLFPWGAATFGWPPYPAYCEFANEVLSIGGGQDNIEEFRTPLLKYQTEADLHYFYNAVQGWADLDAYYRLPAGNGSVVLYIHDGPVKF